MASSNEPGITELAVAIGRIEEMLKNMDEKLSRLQDTATDHADILRKHTVEIELLKQRQGPRVHWSTWIFVLTALASLIISLYTISKG